MKRPDLTAIRARIARRYSPRPGHPSHALAPAIADVRALLVFAVDLDRRVTMMQAERLAGGEGKAARAGANLLARTEIRREWDKNARREARLRAALDRVGKAAA